MIRGEYKDKNRIVDILTRSFDDNKSVNYIIKQDKKRVQRIKKLMDYSFEVCHMFGDVFLSDDKKACALIVLPDKKKTNLKSILLDLKLIISCIGMSNIKKAMVRESKIKKIHPEELMYYLWFIGVDPSEQNIPWYEKFGFKIYNELDLGYRLFFYEERLNKRETQYATTWNTNAYCHIYFCVH